MDAIPEKLVSPDGLFIWKGNKWIKSPPGTSQTFNWNGSNWEPINPKDGGMVLSPDGENLWTGKKWIPIPPSLDVNMTSEQSNNNHKIISRINSFGNHNKNMKNINNIEILKSLLSGIFIFLVTTSMLSSQIIQPLLYDASIVRVGRYALTFDAWDTIEEDNAISVVGIGSSMLQYALDGNCVEDEMNLEDTYVYNLAIPGSMPYIEMIQTEAAVKASPDIIMIEVGPNSLWDVDEFSNDALLDYFELRLTILSLMMDGDDDGIWLDILRDSELSFIANSFDEEFKAESVYADDALEEFLRRILLDDSSAPRSVSAAYVPNPNHEDWHSYLRTQNWLYSKLELMDVEKRMAWENSTVVNAVKYGVNNPEHNGTLNHEALEYMVSRFSETGIKVVLVSPPLHPLLLDELNPGQYDGHNNTLDNLSLNDNVETLNLIWEDYWVDDDFYDHNHLDRHGRQKFCEVLAPYISSYLEN
ncbi:MAG: hypothetical protein HOA28_00030 [Euryarchaeota archaeon]|nr:hypothetical protein [Euryarchaeota archaeon]